MKLLRFDRQVVNMDQVTEIRVTGGRVWLFFANSTTDGYGNLTADSVELKDEAAEAFRQWLWDNAETLVQPAPAPAPDEDIPF